MKNEKGFTLIELIAVISIILILMGIIVPNVSTYTRNASKLKTISEAREIFLAVLESYYNDDNVLSGEDIKSYIMDDADINIDLSNIHIEDNKKNVGISLKNGMYLIKIDAANDLFTVQDSNKKVVYSSADETG